MNIPFPPQLLEMALGRLGLAARQLESIDAETKRAMVKFIFRALGSGDANGYIKERMRWLEERDTEVEPEPERPEPVRARARVVTVIGKESKERR